MIVFKFLHILTMFSAVTLLFGGIVFLDIVGRARDLEAYRRLDAIAQKTDLVAVGLFILGIGLGFVTAITGSIDLTASWLVLAYILVVAIFAEGFLLTIPWYNRIREASQHPDRELAAAEVTRLLESPRHIGTLVVVTALWVAILYVMVVKPSLF